MVPPVRPILDRAPSTCAWCAAPPNGTPAGRSGRTICAACGVATTTPWPTDAELERAYGGPYRPSVGRFAGPGDALLRRFRGRLARRLDRLAPPGPILDVGAGDGALLDALAHRGRDVTGLERDGSGAHIRAGDIGEVDGSGPRSSSGIRSSTSGPGRGAGPRGPPAGAARRPRGRRAEQRQPPGAGLRRSLAGARPPPPPRARAGGRPAGSPSRRGLRVDARQPPARRPGALRLAARARGQPARARATSTTRSAAPRPAAGRCRRAPRRHARRRGRSPSPWRLAGTAARGRRCGAAARIYVEARRG